MTPIASRRLLFPLPLAPTKTLKAPNSIEVSKRDLNPSTRKVESISPLVYVQERPLRLCGSAESHPSPTSDDEAESTAAQVRLIVNPSASATPSGCRSRRR